jgi:inward rectifier potassium channel
LGIVLRIRNPPPSKLEIGGYAMWMKGAVRLDLRDTYHAVIELSWPRFLITLISADLAINIGFALLYLVRPGSVAHARPGSFADAFFFSIETSSTVGYGEMYPATFYGHSVASTEIIAGMAFTALATGLLFVRFARPKARIRYAENAVIASRGGQPTLMIRIANGRHSLLYDAAAHLNLLLTIRGEQGGTFRRVHELHLGRSRLPMFSLTWVLTHKIDAASPLHGYDPARLAEHDACLLLAVEARDVTVGAQVVDTRSYGPSHILFGMRYTEAVSIDAEGNVIGDLGAISRMERDIGPEPPLTGWEDRNWNDDG